MAAPVRRVTILSVIPVTSVDTQKCHRAAIPILIPITVRLHITELLIPIKVPVPSVSMSHMQAKSMIARYVIQRL